MTVEMLNTYSPLLFRSIFAIEVIRYKKQTSFNHSTRIIFRWPELVLAGAFFSHSNFSAEIDSKMFAFFKIIFTNCRHIQHNPIKFLCCSMHLLVRGPMILFIFIWPSLRISLVSQNVITFRRVCVGAGVRSKAFVMLRFILALWVCVNISINVSILAACIDTK